jgi:hypothetical protein
MATLTALKFQQRHEARLKSRMRSAPSGGAEGAIAVEPRALPCQELEGPDPKFLKAVQQADAERERRIRAERTIGALKAPNSKFRRNCEVDAGYDGKAR